MGRGKGYDMSVDRLGVSVLHEQENARKAAEKAKADEAAKEAAILAAKERKREQTRIAAAKKRARDAENRISEAKLAIAQEQAANNASLFTPAHLAYTAEGAAQYRANNAVNNPAYGIDSKPQFHQGGPSNAGNFLPPGYQFPSGNQFTGFNPGPHGNMNAGNPYNGNQQGAMAQFTPGAQGAMNPGNQYNGNQFPAMSPFGPPSQGQMAGNAYDAFGQYQFNNAAQYSNSGQFFQPSYNTGNFQPGGNPYANNSNSSYMGNQFGNTQQFPPAPPGQILPLNAFPPVPPNQVLRSNDPASVSQYGQVNRYTESRPSSSNSTVVPGKDNATQENTNNQASPRQQFDSSTPFGASSAFDDIDMFGSGGGMEGIGTVDPKDIMKKK